MKEIWHLLDFEHNKIYLAGDIGGTNTNLALVGETDQGFDIIYQADFVSSELHNLADAIALVLDMTKEKLKGVKIIAGCISGAGPVKDNDCTLTNLDWNINGNALTEQFNFPIRVINDFIAISYGVPILDLNNTNEIVPLSQGVPGSRVPNGNVSLVIGAGTGLGVSFLINDGDRFMAFPSEGGHASFAPFDTETVELIDYMNRQNNYASEIEQFVCGNGIGNIFNFYKDVKKVSFDSDLQRIADAKHSDKAGLISQMADKNPVCRDIMRTFIKIYGRVAADFSTTLLPFGGIYLAGGIVSKNLQFFLEGRLFMYYFEKNFRPNIEDILRTIPIYVIKDYNVSLYGAANAAKMGLIR
jgi:glucokinase